MASPDVVRYFERHYIDWDTLVESEREDVDEEYEASKDRMINDATAGDLPTRDARTRWTKNKNARDLVYSDSFMHSNIQKDMQTKLDDVKKRIVDSIESDILAEIGLAPKKKYLSYTPENIRTLKKIRNRDLYAGKHFA